MDQHDVIVVGCGIQGATIALAAARRGLNPVILERDDIAAGATGNSFGIIHGGLRYLQSLDIVRWRRFQREQTWFVKNFPDLIHALPCIMPLYRGRLRSPVAFAGALALDRLLSRLPGQGSPLPAGRLLPADFFTEKQVVKEGLAGGALWYNAKFDDARSLIAAILEKAGGRHRTVRTGTDVQAPLLDGDRIAGVSAVDQHSGRHIRFRAPVAILCAGSWLRGLAARFDRDEPMLSAATLAFSVLLDAPVRFSGPLAVSPEPGRGPSYFLRPFDGGLLAGTYYTAGSGMEEPAVSPPHIAEFVAELDRAMPDLRLAQASVRSVWAGLLPDCDGTGRRLRTRDNIWDHGRTGGPRGLYTILGTKLTTARALSEAAARRIWRGTAPTSESGSRRGQGGSDSVERRERDEAVRAS